MGQLSPGEGLDRAMANIPEVEMPKLLWKMVKVRIKNEEVGILG